MTLTEIFENEIRKWDKELAVKISLLDALDFLEKAWRSISSETIANCFSHSRLKNNPVCDNLNEDDVPLCELIKKWQQNQSDENQFCFDDFASVDSCLITSGMRSDSDIVEDIKQRDNENDNEIEEEEDSCDEAELVPTNGEALSAITLLKTCYRQRETPPQIIDKVQRETPPQIIEKLEVDIEKQFWQKP
ncbi:hypothetical protein QE152_g196 [Popillia japonica]|uniref:DDE-1 domain-containing protein n=1 Tax=Popillia japonica TaxID=7064 RepID=A0AAW1NJZ3_POPJA